MSYLMYSKMFGLQEVEELPKFILEGTFIKPFIFEGWHIYTKNAKLKSEWQIINASKLPKQAHIEALLMGIQL